MTKRERLGGAHASRRLYRRLLLLYPRGFRDRFGDQMLDDFGRMYEAHVREAGWRGALRVWGQIVRDTVVAASREHRDRHRSGRRGTRGSTLRMAGHLIPDLRMATRGLRRRPGYALVAITTLALAIGANTTLFSVLHGVLLRPLPYPESDRLALLTEGEGSFNNVSYPNYQDWRERTGSFQEMGAFSWTALNVTGGSDPLRVTVGLADPSFLRAAGLEPVLGRSLLDEENVPGARAVTILSHGLWQQSFGADPNVLGRTVGLDGTPTEIVGVLGVGADFAEAGVALWVPVVPSIGEWAERREVHALSVLGRLAPGISMESARLELERLGEVMALEYAEENAGRGATLIPLHDALLGEVVTAVWLLMGMVGLVLVIACANVGSLLLVRLSARRGELSVRRALGASRWDLTRLFLTETMVLTFAGGALGVGMAYTAIGPAARLLQGHLPRLADVSLDTTVLLFAFALSAVTGLVFGLMSGLGGDDPEEPARSSAGRGLRGAGRSTGLARATLCAAQIAGTVVLLIGAGLLMRSLQGLQSVDVGFDPENLATIAVSLSGSGKDAEEVIQFYRELPSLLETVPGVLSAAAVNALPISGGDSNGTVTIEGRTFPLGEAPNASFRRITPRYFQTVGTPVLHGRDFAPSDLGEPMVTIINESMARLLWADPADAVGARIKIGPPDYEPWLTVVGVTGDMRNVDLATEPRLATYEPHAQRPWTTMSLVFRTAGDPAQLTDVVRQRVREAGGDIPVYDFSTLHERISESLRPRRVALVLTAAFALLALLTASIGVYGVLAYSVAQRAPELGVRLALGAGGRRILSVVALQAGRMIGAGIVVGLIAAAALGGVLESVLHGVSPYDAATFVAVPLTLALVGALACYVPARRATRIDPATSLRSE